MAETFYSAIYLLCAAASIACATLLLRGWIRSRARFLLWSGLCFTMLAVNNALLVADVVIWKEYTGFAGLEFRTWRGLAALAGIAMLLWGIVFDAMPRTPGARREDRFRSEERES